MCKYEMNVLIFGIFFDRTVAKYDVILMANTGAENTYLKFSSKNILQFQKNVIPLHRQT